MANKSSSTNIKNEVDNFIMQQQRALANIVTQSVVNISHKIIQEQSASIVNNASASNILNGYQIIVRNGAKFSINQQNTLKVNAQAILNLTQDNTLVLNLSNNIRQNVMSTLSQNADISNKLAAAATLLREQKTSGEINGVISAISDLGSEFLNSVNTTRDRNDITNHVVQKYLMKQESNTDLNNLVNNTINQTIQQKNISDCINNSTLSNIINLKRIVVDGPTATFTITQKNILDAFYKCVISSIVKTSDLQKISNDIINRSSQSAQEAVESSVEAEAADKSIFTRTITSWLDNLSSMIGVIVVIVIICVIYIIAKLFWPSNSSNMITISDTGMGRSLNYWNNVRNQFQGY